VPCSPAGVLILAEIGLNAVLRRIAACGKKGKDASSSQEPKKYFFESEVHPKEI